MQRYLEIAIGVTKGRNRSATNVVLNADRLAFLVIDKNQLGELDENGLAFPYLVFLLA